MPRVVSKNLFNFPLQGTMDEDFIKADALLMEKMESSKKWIVAKLAELKEKDDPEFELKYVKMFREMLVDPIMRETGNQPGMLEYAKQIDTTTFHVPTTHDGNFGVPVEVYTPKKLAGEKSNPAYIYAHGGGAVASNAADHKPWLDIIAVETGMVVFNVEYRLAPETKCPNNVKDFYETIKYIKNNSASLGVDPDRIAIGGESGGGYICLGAMVLLAQNDETDLVKLAMPAIPMVDDYCFSSPECMTIDERFDLEAKRKLWKLIAADMETQKDDPLLFPGKASDELLEKFPPTIILANRLRRAGRLLELIVIPGIPHTGTLHIDLKASKMDLNAFKTAINEYLI